MQEGAGAPPPLRRNDTSFPEKSAAALRRLHERFLAARADPGAPEHAWASALKYYQFLARAYMSEREFGVGAPGNARGLLVFLTMGMGKTREAVAVAMAVWDARPVVVLLARSLQRNFRETVAEVVGLLHPGAPAPELARLRAEADARLAFVSMDAYNAADQMARAGKKRAPGGARSDVFASALGGLDGKLLIIDEAHNLFRAIINSSAETSNARRLYSMVMEARDLRLLFLTGTPAAKDPFELVPCFNMLAGTDLLPTQYEVFYRLFVDRAAHAVKNPGLLANRLLGLVSHVTHSRPSEPAVFRPPPPGTAFVSLEAGALRAGLPAAADPEADYRPLAELEAMPGLHVFALAPGGAFAAHALVAPAPGAHTPPLLAAAAPAGTSWLEELFVAPALRGRGFGAAVAASAVAAAGRQGTSVAGVVRDDAPASAAILSRLGFEAAGREGPWGLFLLPAARARAGAPRRPRDDGWFPEALPLIIERVEMGPHQYRQYLLARELEEAEGKGGFGGKRAPPAAGPALSLPGAEKKTVRSYFVHSRGLSTFCPPPEFAGTSVASMPAEVFTPSVAPKLALIARRAAAAPGPVLVYSQFVENGGLRALSRFLERAGFVPFDVGASRAAAAAEAASRPASPSPPPSRPASPSPPPPWAAPPPPEEPAGAESERATGGASAQKLQAQKLQAQREAQKAALDVVLRSAVAQAARAGLLVGFEIGPPLPPPGAEMGAAKRVSPLGLRHPGGSVVFQPAEAGFDEVMNATLGGPIPRLDFWRLCRLVGCRLLQQENPRLCILSTHEQVRELDQEYGIPLIMTPQALELRKMLLAKKPQLAWEIYARDLDWPRLCRNFDGILAVPFWGPAFSDRWLAVHGGPPPMWYFGLAGTTPPLTVLLWTRAATEVYKVLLSPREGIFPAVEAGPEAAAEAGGGGESSWVSRATCSDDGRRFFYTEELWKALEGGPAAEVPCAELEGQLAEPQWSRPGETHSTISARDVLASPEEFPDHAGRISSAELSWPIILVAGAAGPRILDGMHRLARAVRDGAHSILAQWATPEALDAAFAFEEGPPALGGGEIEDAIAELARSPADAFPASADARRVAREIVKRRAMAAETLRTHEEWIDAAFAEARARGLLVSFADIRESYGPETLVPFFSPGAAPHGVLWASVADKQAASRSWFSFSKAFGLGWTLPEKAIIGYRFDLSRAKVLDTAEAVLAFDAEFGVCAAGAGVDPAECRAHSNINWGKVALEFSGVVVAPYLLDARAARADDEAVELPLWYRHFDGASYMVWDPRAVLETVVLYEPPKAETSGGGEEASPRRTFSDGHREYDIEKLWALTENLPAIPIAVEGLRWLLDEPAWKTPDMPELSPRRVLDRMDDFPAHAAAIRDADLSFPILIASREFSDSRGDVLIVDGTHRLCRAVLEGRASLPGRFLTPELLDMAVLRELAQAPSGEKDCACGGAPAALLRGGAKGGPPPCYAVISGAVSNEDRDAIKEAFNRPENAHGAVIKAILVSKTGAEGLDLKWIRETHVVESYWDQARLDQVEARAIRMKAHDGLPWEERTVQPYLYLGVANRSVYESLPEKEREPRSIDEVFYTRARERFATNLAFRELLAEVSIECTQLGYGKCHTCAPTGVPLFRADALRDAALPDPCEKCQSHDVEAEPVEIGGVTYYAAPDGAGGRKFYVERLDLGGFAPVDPSDPALPELLRRFSLAAA